jgi:hypothetical protein
MALFEIDPDQFEQLNSSISGLSTNLAKWQAQQTATIESGFTNLIAALTGADVAEVQERINTLTQAIKPEADALETANQSETQPSK